MKSVVRTEMWQEIKRIMTTAVRDVCGVNKMNRKNRMRWKEYLTKRTEEKYNKYKQQRNIVKNMVKEAQNKAWQEFGEKLETVRGWGVATSRVDGDDLSSPVETPARTRNPGMLRFESSKKNWLRALSV
ncbi:hypothetical protein Zmor_015535 [Zophobas morio]|uniref:Uncharacterized protein n=1 Tax=Zophobas morio TaxID=2755281 RepID=A0AA38IMZ2_9CUCU|nr:hypothetical protein Zmor_015535 [Zophobas morio]